MSYYLEAYLVEDFNQSLGTAHFSHYDAIRQILKPEYSNLADAEIEAMLRRVLGRMSPEEVEGFWDTTQRGGQTGCSHHPAHGRRSRGNPLRRTGGYGPGQ